MKNLNKEKELNCIKNKKKLDEQGIVIDDIFISNKNFLRALMKDSKSAQRKG